jgi:hypothetical protein
VSGQKVCAFVRKHHQGKGVRAGDFIRNFGTILGKVEEHNSPEVR